MCPLFGFFGWGPWEIVLVALVALLLFGNRLPSVMRSLGKGIVEFAITAVTIITEPCILATPVDVLFGFPDILTPAGETKGLETH